MAEQNKMEELQPEDLELSTILQNWDSVKQFFKDVEARQAVGGSDKIKEAIDNINGEIISYADRVRGARMKILKKEKLEKADTSEQDSDSSTSESDTEDIGECKLLKSLVRKLDNRNSPQMEPFSQDSELSLRDFLDQFEKYYKKNHKRGTFVWIRELEKKLTGQALEGLRAVRQSDESYSTTKAKLIDWYNEEQKLKIDKNRLEFRDITYNQEESIFAFSNRLLTLFKLAYPNKAADESATLISKLQ